jgi:hypothetical protein
MWGRRNRLPHQNRRVLGRNQRLVAQSRKAKKAAPLRGGLTTDFTMAAGLSSGISQTMASVVSG